MLTNSEVWYNIKETEISELEEVDHYLLRKILKAHSKTPKEMLYLETGAIPIRFIIKQRRLSYLHHLLTRDQKELINKVYLAQKRKSVKGDWAMTVKNDIEEINLNLSEEQIKTMKKGKFKENLKCKIVEASFKYLQNIKETHSKVKHVFHKDLKIQPYFKNNNFSIEEKQML